MASKVATHIGKFSKLVQIVVGDPPVGEGLRAAALQHGTALDHADGHCIIRSEVQRLDAAG